MIPFYSCKEDDIFDDQEKPKFEIKELGDGYYSLQLSGLEEIPPQVKSKIKLSNVIQLNIDFGDIQTLPQNFFAELTNVQILSAAGNSFRTFDASKLENLERLNLDYNVLSQLPENILQLKKLKTLTLRNNFITNIPLAFGDLTDLEDLSLYGNELSQLPLSFGNLTKLVNLDLSYNRLYELPDNFGNLVSLQMLRMCHNCLVQLPKTFENLPNLQTLDVSENELISLPQEFKSCHTLRKFCADENELTSIPLWFNNCSNLIDISIKNNLLQGQLSEQFGIKNSKLTNLDFSGNNLNSSFPESLSSLKSLKVIDFGKCVVNSENRVRNHQQNIISLPPTFGKNLINLTQLKLDNCQINQLPGCFGENLYNLESLNLGHNNLINLPDSFCYIKNLSLCILSWNKLKFLPQNFGNLIKLVELRLEHNLIYLLPPTFDKLVNLKRFDLYNNKFKLFPSPLRYLPSLKCLGTEVDITTIVIDFVEIKSEILKLSQAISIGNKRWNRPKCKFSSLKASVNSRYLYNERRIYRNIKKQIPPVVLNEDLWDDNVDDDLSFDNIPPNDTLELQSFQSLKKPLPKFSAISMELMPHLPQKPYPSKIQIKTTNDKIISGQFEEDV